MKEYLFGIESAVGRRSERRCGLSSPTAAREGGSVGRTVTVLGIFIWAVALLLATAQQPRYIPVLEAVVSGASVPELREIVAADVKVARGIISAVNGRRLMLHASGTPSADYAFDLIHSVIRRGGKEARTEDLVPGDTIGVLYIESGGARIAKMVLAPASDAAR